MGAKTRRIDDTFSLLLHLRQVLAVAIVCRTKKRLPIERIER